MVEEVQPTSVTCNVLRQYIYRIRFQSHNNGLNYRYWFYTLAKRDLSATRYDRSYGILSRSEEYLTR